MRTTSGVAGSQPPVAIALGGLVAGEQQRRALVDEHDVANTAAHGKVLGGRNAADPRAADHDLGTVRSLMRCSIVIRPRRRARPRLAGTRLACYLFLRESE